MTRAKNICISTLKATFISLLCCYGMIGQAHPLAPADSSTPEQVNEDSIPFFRNVAVGIDIVGPIWFEVYDYGEYEASLRVNLKDKYFPVVELGIGRAHVEDEASKITYKTAAPYARVGLDFNIMKNKHDVYRLYAGFRYAFTNFKYEIDHPGVKDPVWQNVATYHVKDVKCNCHWAELGIGVDAKIWGPLRLGWNVRYRRRLFHKDNEEVGKTWYVPGFGLSDNSEFGANFNVVFEL